MKPALPLILQLLNRAIGDGLSSQSLLAGITVLTHAVVPPSRMSTGHQPGAHVWQGAGFLEHRSATEKSIQSLVCNGETGAGPQLRLSCGIPGHRPFSLCGVKLELGWQGMRERV